MTTPDDISRALGRVEGQLQGIQAGQDDLRRELVEQIDSKHRENQQQNLSARETLTRIETAAAERARAHDAAITRVRTDLQVQITDHDVRIGHLESAESRRQWFRALIDARVKPVTALFWTATGAVVLYGVDQFLH